MDPTPIADGIAGILSSYPTTAAALAMIPVAQVIARAVLMIPGVVRTHPTYLTRALTWFTRWPGPRV